MSFNTSTGLYLVVRKVLKKSWKYRKQILDLIFFVLEKL
jgi:hypothetical protein